MKIKLQLSWFYICFSTLLYATLIEPIPYSINVDKNKALLGKKLFFDTILSKDHKISCASCHDLQNGGDDGLKFSVGINGAIGTINSPTVLNSTFNFRQFWDGRAKDLKEQASVPIENPIEMGHDINVVIYDLKKDKNYVADFLEIYDEGITKNTIVDAIAEFEKSLITPNAPFDKYLNGDKEAISQSVKNGYKLFIDKGCIVCHNGINVGGNLYNKFGIYKKAESSSLGRYDITKREEDKYVFKVPSLRNVELTAPYMHDGRFKTLKKTVVFMTNYQLGRHIDDKDIEDIVKFLNALTGELPKIAEVK